MPRERYRPAVRRHNGTGPAALLAHERLDRAALHVDRVEIGLPIAIVGVRLAQPVEHDRAAVGRPVIVRRAEAAELARREVAGGELPWRAAVRRNEEDLGRALLHEPGAVAAIVQPIHDTRRGRPLRPFRRRGHADLPWRFTLDEHRESERPAIGRPAQVRRRLADARDLGRGAFRIHPADKDLRPLRLTVGEVGDPRAVGRPARTRTLHEKTIARAVGVHDPERRIPAVLDLVHPAARVDDLRARRRDLRIGDLFPVEVVVDGKQRVGCGFLTRGYAWNDDQRG